MSAPSTPERADGTERSSAERADGTERSSAERADGTEQSLPEPAADAWASGPEPAADAEAADAEAAVPEQAHAAEQVVPEPTTDAGLSVPEPRPAEPTALLAAVDDARAAAVDEAALDLDRAAAAAAVGEHLDAVVEAPGAVTHYFAAAQPGYRGWRWSVTVSGGSDGDPVTVSEVVLLPGVDALVAPAWVPWDERVRPGDLGVGDLLPPRVDDERLVPAYVASDDPAVEAVATEVGLGRKQVLSRFGRSEAAQRWLDGPHGPHADMARSAPDHCGTCGFFLPLGGALQGAFGACANEFSPADGTIVEVGYGCGAHSDVVVEQVSPVAVAELVYDDGVDLEPVTR